MAESTGEGVPSRKISLEQASSRFCDKIGPLQVASFKEGNVDLLIPQRATVDIKPLYPPSHPWSHDGNYILTEAAGDLSITDTMRERMAIMLDVASELLPASQVIERGLDRPEAYSGMRIADLLLDYENKNIVKLLVTMSDANFTRFMELVRRDELPKALTSDQEMKRLLDNYKRKLESSNTARGRFTELCHDLDYYGHDEQGRETVSPMGGPAYAEYNKNVNLPEVIGILNREFSNG